MDPNYSVIFDLDGVLIDSRELHYEALNKAIETVVGSNYLISKEEHLSTYDGLPTSKKLRMLTEKKGLPANFHSQIATYKQMFTQGLIGEIKPNLKLIGIFSYLKSKGFKIGVASNAVSNTVHLAIKMLGLEDLVDNIQTNQTVSIPKPYPSMYWRCMESLASLPRTTLIVEDSHLGRQAVIDSGAHLLPVENPDDLTMEKVLEGLKMLQVDKPRVPWRDSKLNVLIPMAGAGSRFEKAGYTFPKPLIDVNGKPMIQVVVESLNIQAHFIFLVQKSHYERYNLKQVLNLIAPGCDIVQVDGVTEGAACTTLLAKDYINNDRHLLICNSDQYIEWNSNEVMYAFSADKIDGGILTFKNTHPKWSYAKLDDNGFVSEVAEKNPISDNATVGIYYWSKGSDYVKYAESMISKDIRVNGEFYVAPVFNEAISDGKKFRIKQVERMMGIGDPESLTTFLSEKKEKSGQVAAPSTVFISRFWDPLSPILMQSS